MNNELANILYTHLSNATHNVIKVASGGVRLVKPNADQRYTFSLHDIEQKYDTLANFLQTIAKKGFQHQVEFSLYKMYESKGTYSYRLIETITKDLTHDMHEADNNAVPTYYPQVQSPNFLGSPELMSKMVEAERSADYKEQISELKEAVKDLRSKNRVLEEQNSSLTIKLETAKEREELRVQKELLNKKSFLETPAFEKTMETLGGMLPKMLEVANTKNTAPSTGLNMPNLSPIKKAFVQKLPNATDEQVMFFNYLLGNWKEDLIQHVAQHIEQQTQNNEEHTD